MVRKFNWLVIGLLALAGLTAGAAGCAGTLPPPKRRVIEKDLGSWHFRRYQHVVDVEVFVAGNPADAHAASYSNAAAEKRGRITDADVANAFVTEYAQPAGVIPALVRFARRLAQESGYVVAGDEVGGQNVLRVVGHGEAWAFWASGRYVVKVGGRGLEKVPGSLVKEYGRRYPSKLKDGALEGAIDDADAPEESDE